jgi:hypothetical protein
MDEFDEMIMQPFTGERQNYEVPFLPIKAFARSIFNKKSFVFPLRKLERMSHFLGCNYVVRNYPSFYQSLLSRVNVIRKIGF